MTDYLYIDNQRDLTRFLNQCSDLIAVDTEFTRKNTYRMIPELLQIATPRQIGIVDLRTNLTLSNLAMLFQSKEVVRVAHSVSQDVELLVDLFHSPIGDIQDTQLADRFIRSNEPQMIGYSQLVRTYLDVELDKSLQRSNWSQRPLDSAQLEYAANDIAHLLRIWKLLNQKLLETNRMNWYLEELRRLQHPSSHDPSGLPVVVRDLFKLNEVSYQFVRDLEKWRNVQAEKRDIPKGWVISNKQIFQIATLSRLSDSALSEILTEKQTHRYRSIFRRLHSQAFTQAGGHGALNFWHLKPVVMDLSAKCLVMTKELSISENLLATQRDLLFGIRAIVHHGNLPSWFGKWREQLFGEELYGAAKSLKLGKSRTRHKRNKR